MTDLSDWSILGRNLRCFGDEPAGFERLGRVNLVIGRNNAGKSQLLDLLRLAIGNTAVDKQWGRNGAKTPAAVVFRRTLTLNDLQRVFQANTSGGEINGNHGAYAKRHVGKHLAWAKIGQHHELLPELCSVPASSEATGMWQSLVNILANQNQLHTLRFRRLLAARDLKPEAHGDWAVSSEDGSGITNLFQNFLNVSGRHSELVEATVLDALNRIFGPDEIFKRLQIKLIDGQRWELFVESADRGRIALSSCGSGMKTVLIVLAYLILIPASESRALSEYVFCFEELENNLHPALQRKLLEFVREYASINKCTLFLSTHSSVAIDLLTHYEDTRVFHITHGSAGTRVAALHDYASKIRILDDLEVRASDLLQANAIVWVEGPTDRIYINKWLSLLSHGKLREGVHYQCVFYGGKLLSHLSAGEDASLINVLRVNRHGVIVVDSDKSSAADGINATKQRLANEVADVNGHAWITGGREIENYVPQDVIERVVGAKLPCDIGQFKHIGDVLEGAKIEGWEKFSSKKVLFAEEAVKHITADHLDRFDLRSSVSAIVDRLSAWNGLL